MESLITVIQPRTCGNRPTKTKQLFITISDWMWVVVWYEYIGTKVSHITVVGSYHTIIDAASKFHEEVAANGSHSLIIRD